MEMTGINEAAQAIEVSIKGFDTVARLGGNFVGWTLEMMIRLTKFLTYTISKQKNKPEVLAHGEQPLDKMFRYCAKNNEETMIMQIDENQLQDFMEYAGNNNLTYSRVVDGNPGDKKLEIAYTSGQQAAFAVYINSRYPKASAYSWGEYEANITPEMAQQVDQALSEEVKSNTMPADKKYMESRNYGSVLRMDNTKFTAFMEFAKHQNVEYSSYVTGAGNNVIIEPEAYDKVDVFCEYNGLHKTNVAEFINENMDNYDIAGNEKLKAMAYHGSNINLSPAEKFVRINKAMISDSNDFSIKLKVNAPDGDKATINVPRSYVMQGKDNDELLVKLPQNEFFNIYKETKFTSIDGDGQIRSLPQYSSGIYKGNSVAVMLFNKNNEYMYQKREGTLGKTVLTFDNERAKGRKNEARSKTKSNAKKGR
jgi:hypothetical protein